MAMFLTASLIIFSSLLVIYFRKGRTKYPGPGIFETIKGFINMDGELHVLFSRWAEKYGSFYSVFLGYKRYFVVSDGKLMKELFQLDEYSGRPVMGGLDPFCIGVAALINSNGKAGQVHRTFAMATLKSFGVGKSQMNQLLMEEITEFMDNLERKKGQEVCTKKMFMKIISNSLWISIASKRFTENDSTLKTFTEFLLQADKLTESPLTALSPQLTYSIPWIPVWSRYCKAYSKLYQVLEKMVDEHKETRIINEPRDFIDAYLDKMQTIQDENSCFYSGKNLVPVLIDFVIAGSDTMSVALEWCLVQMIRHLDVQKKVHQELRSVVGRNRLPNLADRPNCVYTEATLLEILRITPPTTLTLPHCTTADTRVAGKYFLPKNSPILGNLYLIQRDKEVWGDPEIFRPERWLTKNADGNPKLNKSYESLVVWSTGKRRCVGEALSRDSLFLLFTSILSRFEILSAPNQPVPTLKAKGLILSAPLKFSVIFTPIKGESN